MQNHALRLANLQNLLEESSLDSIVVSPGPDLRYLTGYDAVALERLTALLLRKNADPIVISPLLERSAAAASPIGALGLEIVTWTETENPYELVAKTVGSIQSFAVDARMWAEKLIHLQTALPSANAVSANQLISQLRMRKAEDEIAALHRAGLAIDAVHAEVANLLKPGRTEAEVGKDIAQLILDAGHVTADFVIVGGGPNSASPHHEVSARVLKENEPIVVDIGGAMPDGYCSDSTRTYFIGDPTPEYLRNYEILQEAQQLATAAVKPGVACEEIDAVARRHMSAAGIGDLFIHRIGHGIGLETHEDPYMVAGNHTLLEPGMAFSIEPGFYIDGQYGARIEDIVVCGEAEAIVLNNRPRELVII